MSGRTVASGGAQGRVLARNTAWNLAGLTLPLLAAAAAMPALVARLGPGRFGLLSLVWMLQSFAGDLGFGRATTRFAALVRDGARGRLGRIVWTTVALQLVIGACAALALLAAAGPLVRLLRVEPALAGDARAAVLGVAALLPLTLVSSAWRGLLEAEQRFDMVNLVRVPSTAAMFLLPLLAIVLGAGLPVAVWAIVAGRGAGLLAYAALALRQVPALARPAFGGEDAAAVLAFGSWATVSTVVSPALAQLERWFLGGLAGAAALGYYTPAFEVGTRLADVPAAFTLTLFPAITALVGAGDAAGAVRLAARGARVVLALFGPVILVGAVGAADLLRVWLGAEFAARSTVALQVLLVGVLVNALAQIPFAVLQSLGRADITAKIHLAELPVYALAAYLLVRRWGIPGAAAAWTARATVDAALLFVSAGVLSPLRWRALRAERVPQLMAFLLCFGALAAALTGSQHGAGARLLAAALSLGAAVALLWRFGLAPAERGRLAEYAQLVRPRTAERT